VWVIVFVESSQYSSEPVDVVTYATVGSRPVARSRTAPSTDMECMAACCGSTCIVETSIEVSACDGSLLARTR
jgi:hypothetical protein